MGMICCLQPIDAGQIDALLAQPASIHDVLEEGYEAGIDLDKSWHAIHYLLTGSTWEGEKPACFLLSGGEQVGDEDVGYGPARVLRPTDVRRFDAVLQQVDSAELRRRYDPPALVKAEIYPDIWDREEEREENFEYVSQYFEELRRFISDVANQENGIIISVS